MFHQLFIISAVTLTAYCQYPSSQQYSPSSQSPSQYSSGSIGSSLGSSSQYSPSQYSSSQYSATTPPPKPSFPPAQIHYVNIGADLAGDYKFGYDTGKGPMGQSFREESRLPDGTVKGAYGYVDANGRQRVVKYTAGKEGFKVEGDLEPDQNAAPASAPARPAAPSYTQSIPTQTYRAPTQYVNSQPAVSSYRPAAPSQYSQPALSSYRPPSAQYRPALSQISSQPSYQSLPAAPVQSRPQYTTQSFPQSAPQPAYRAPAQSLSSVGSSFRQPVEETTYGPPVINTALLNYNIGTQHG